VYNEIEGIIKKYKGPIGKPTNYQLIFEES
jgi:hypothetical protein